MYNEKISGPDADFNWSISVGIFALGGMIGGVFSGFFADTFGRKGALLLNTILAFAGAGLMTSSKYLNIYHIMTIGRFVIGINSGNFYKLI